MTFDFTLISEDDFCRVFNHVTGEAISPAAAGMCMRTFDDVQNMEIVADPVKRAWVAGIIEGEGCLGLHMKQPKKSEPYPMFKISVNMTDEDVIKKLHAYVGAGTISGPCFHKNPKFKPFWRWHVNRRDIVYLLCSLLLPHFGNRRAAKAQKIMEAINQTPKPAWQHGTRHGYTRGCRCRPCTTAHSADCCKRRQSRAARPAL